MRLYHLSDDPNIAAFHPRPSRLTITPVVWAVAEDRLSNYLLPRDCPRVCIRANSAARREDIARFLGAERAIVAIEAAWADRVATASLHCYEMPSESFKLADEPAGYWVSDRIIVPASMTTISDLPAAIEERRTKLVVLESLWDLREAVATSTLTYSMIRMRNAAPR